MFRKIEKIRKKQIKMRSSYIKQVIWPVISDLDGSRAVCFSSSTDTWARFTKPSMVVLAWNGSMEWLFIKRHFGFYIFIVFGFCFQYYPFSHFLILATLVPTHHLCLEMRNKLTNAPYCLSFIIFSPLLFGKWNFFLKDEWNFILSTWFRRS